VTVRLTDDGLSVLRAFLAASGALVGASAKLTLARGVDELLAKRDDRRVEEDRERSRGYLGQSRREDAEATRDAELRARGELPPLPRLNFGRPRPSSSSETRELQCDPR
jgi:hypothetical protein